MSQSYNAWEATSPRDSLFDPQEPVRVTVQLWTAGKGKRKINQYSKSSRIGKGLHGEVYLCDVDNDPDRKVAVKAVKRSSPRDKIKLLRRNYQQNETTSSERPYPLNSTENSIRKEIAVMKKCRHPNIVRLMEVIDDPQQEKIFMIMEYCSGGPVQWVNESKQPLLHLEQTRRIMRDILLGLEYLHSLGIIHRDIKPANLLYNNAERTIVKIIDFGVSHYSVQRSVLQSYAHLASEDDILFPESDLQKMLGTPNFLAPEVVWFDNSENGTSGMDSSRSSMTMSEKTSMPKTRPPITEALDIWSLGVTFYCFLFGRTPFNVPPSCNDNVHHNEWMLYNQICTQDWDVDATMAADQVVTGGRHPNDTSKEGYAIVTLLDSMLQKDPLSRASLTNLKQHPWILHNIFNPKEWLRATSPSPVPLVSRGPLLHRWLQSVRQRLTRIRTQ